MYRNYSTLKTLRGILSSWCEVRTRKTGIEYTENAIEEALFLTHRFLARDRLPRKAIDLLLQAGSIRAGVGPVGAGEILDRFCGHHRIPRFLVDPSISLDLSQVEEFFMTRVLGQEEAVQAVVRMIGMIKAGLSDMRRMFGAFLFVGPTGVGKTHLTQLLTAYLFGSADRMIRLNMVDFPHEKDSELLFGDPDNDNLTYKRGILTKRITGHPFAVMLLDEFEKAHPKIHDRFLQLFDEGSFINGAGESVSCRSMILIATSNTGAEVYRGKTIGFKRLADFSDLDREVDRCLERQFRFELLNRFDRVVHFHPLSREHIRIIARKELESLRKRPGLRQRKLELEVDEDVMDWLAVHGYDPDYGARFLRRVIERNVTTALADAVVRNGAPRDSKLVLSVRRNKICATLPPSSDPNAAPTPVKLPMGKEEKVRVLDTAGLLKEIDTLLSSAEKRLDGLEDKRREASGLLSDMNEPGFWEESERKRETLDRYRMLDVSIQLETRLAEPIIKLTDTRAEMDNTDVNTGLLSKLTERAAEALREWDERMAEDGIAALWLVVSNADPLRHDERSLESLVSMELAWCRNLGLSASVAAYGISENVLSRAVLEVEGPGASVYLAMEQGIHRIRKTQANDFKARVEIIPHELN